MAKEWTDIATIVGGCVRLSDLGYLAFRTDPDIELGIESTFFQEWDAGEFGKFAIFKDKDAEWLLASSAVAEIPNEQAVFVGEQGDVFVVGGGDEHFETIGGPGGNPGNRGPLRYARCIDGKVYVCGMNRQIYRRDAHSVWTACDEGARPAKGDKAIVGFESIDGFSAKDMYAVGWKGEIWHGNGAKWAQIDSPTNLVLSSVCCAGDGVVYACGRRGLLVAGRGDRWEVLSHKGIPSDLWSLCWFKDKLYAASMERLFTYDKERGFEIVDMGEDIPSSCYWLSARDGVMWSIGAKDVMAFDGKTWTRIE